MLRSKLETRLRGLIAFSVLAVMGALVSGTSAQFTPPEIGDATVSAAPRIMVLSVKEGSADAKPRQMTVVHMTSDCALPEPPIAPVPPLPPAGAVL